MKYLSFSINGTPIEAPAGVPTGGIDTGQKIIQAGITILFVVSLLIALLYIMQGGIQWVTSRGDKQLVEQARLRLTYSIVGIILIAFAFVIVRFIISLLGGTPGFFFGF